MSLTSVPLDPEHYEPHPLHGADVDWVETNCATDMWIEILHAWGLDPVPGLAFTVGTDFDGEQWRMFTYPEEDLRLIYGIEVHELNIWRALISHIEDHLRLGHMIVVDVDAYYLPDTRDLTYHLSHQKTTIAVHMIDSTTSTVRYFHNAGYAEACGDDFNALFHSGAYADPLALAVPPFAAVVRFDVERVGSGQLMALVLDRLRVHLARRPAVNPVARLGKRMTEDLPDIASSGLDAFHRYAFGSCRSLGANGDLAATFVQWLVDHDTAANRKKLGEAVASYRAISAGAKALQFTLARAAKHRPVDLRPVMAPLVHAWDRAVSILDQQYGA